MILNSILIFILLNVILSLLYLRRRGEPILYLSIGLLLSITSYMITLKSALSFTTTAYIIFFFFAYICGYMLAFTTTSYCKYDIADRRRSYSLILSLSTCFISFLVLFITVQSDGLINYFANAMLLRTNVANPSAYTGVESFRPGYLHILSMILFYFTLFYVLNDKFKTINQNSIHLFFLSIAVILISISDISRARFMDFLLIILITSYSFGNKKQIAKSVKVVCLGFIILFLATIFQGKASNLFDFIQHVTWYIGAPIYYFDRDFEFLKGQHLNGSESFHAVFNLLNIIGAIDEYIRIDNRGISKTGWKAVLVYPGFKHFVIDFGYLGSLVAALIFGYISKSLCIFYRYSKMNTAITLSVIYLNFNFYSSYRLGDNFYFVALVFIILLAHSKRLKF